MIKVPRHQARSDVVTFAYGRTTTTTRQFSESAASVPTPTMRSTIAMTTAMHMRWLPSVAHLWSMPVAVGCSTEVTRALGLPLPTAAAKPPECLALRHDGVKWSPIQSPNLAATVLFASPPSTPRLPIQPNKNRCKKS